jgi:hypothetical protein
MAKSAHRFEPEMRSEQSEPSRGSSLPGNVPFRNVSGEDTGPFMRHRNAPAASDRFRASYVEEPSRKPVRGRSGRYSAPLTDATGTVPAGARPRPSDYHDGRLHRSPAEVARRRREAEAGGRDWSNGAAGGDSWARRVGCPYPAAFRAEIEEY